jgi:ketosteroid isomerase-like protein
MAYERKNKELVKKYYNSWAKRDRQAVRECLADDFIFRSPQDVFYKADDFLDGCWHYGEDVDEVKFVKSVVQVDEAFVLLEWFHTNTGKSFHDTEYIKIKDGKFKEILVIINDPEFYRNLMRKN